MEYAIEVTRGTPEQAVVRWHLAGIDEIERVRLRFDPERFSGFAASGILERRPGEILWHPQGPYAELRYRVVIPHRRTPDKGFDSYAGEDWVLTRTTDLFPRTSVIYRDDVEPDPEARASLTLRLPRDWTAVTIFPASGPGRFLVETPGQGFDHPRGWLAYGRLRRTEALVAGTALTIARVPGATRAVEPILRLLEQALPVMNDLFARALPRLLIVIGPDPMWRGGLSGEESFYIHERRPLRSRDFTSPYLHELFHVAAPFRPHADAHWVTEGLAEYYALELQRRIGRLSQAQYRRALQSFADEGVWGRDFTRTGAAGLRNNSAPLVMYALDRRISSATAGRYGLDAVVTSLARDGGAVSTARFLGAVERVAGKSFAGFFRRHVYRGERPALLVPGS